MDRTARLGRLGGEVWHEVGQGPIRDHQSGTRTIRESVSRDAFLQENILYRRRSHVRATQIRPTGYSPRIKFRRQEGEKQHNTEYPVFKLGNILHWAVFFPGPTTRLWYVRVLNTASDPPKIGRKTEKEFDFFEDVETWKVNNLFNFSVLKIMILPIFYFLGLKNEERVFFYFLGRRTKNMQLFLKFFSPIIYHKILWKFSEI